VPVSAIDIETLQPWVGRVATRCDTIAPAPVAALSACLDHERPRALSGEPLPAGWHWLYFLETVAASGLGTDGHARRGGFTPPVPLPRRMWAGGRLRFHSPLRVGVEARRESTIAAIHHKRGRSGDLVFLTLRHRVYVHDELVIEEEQDLVYRGEGPGGAAGEAVSAPGVAQWSRAVTPDTVMLFRYSALTFNSHRIHYDRDYATGVEGYSSLVVQGPLTATLLLDLLHREMPGAGVAAFEFRAVRPVLEGALLTLQGRADGTDVSLWALDNSGALAMRAKARLRTE